MHILVENGIFTEVWNEGLCLMISVDPNIALHVSIQKVIPVLKTLFSVSFYGSTIQQMHRDFKLIGKVLVFKPYASDYCNTNSENAEWEAQEFFFNGMYNRIFLSSVSSQTSKQQAWSRLQFCFFFQHKVVWGPH